MDEPTSKGWPRTQTPGEAHSSPLSKHYPVEPDVEWHVQQHFGPEVDVNNIVERWLKTGVNPHPAPREAMYGDFSNVMDFDSARAMVDQVEHLFSQLPPLLQEQLGHNPTNFLTWCEDESNQKELVRWGLVPDRPEPSADERSDATIRGIDSEISQPQDPLSSPAARSAATSTAPPEGPASTTAPAQAPSKD